MRAHDRSGRDRRASRLAVATGASSALVLAMLVAPSAASAAGYPTWAQVEAAKGNAAATQAQVDLIDASLDSLEKAASDRSDEAVLADQANATARADLAAASRRADELAADAERARATADTAKQEAGQLAGSLFRTGGTQTMGTDLFTSPDPGAALYQLGSLTQLGARWQTVLADATRASNTVSSLSEQASTAADRRDALARDAQAAADQATAAQPTADTEVADATQRSADLYAQLAALKDSTAELEQQYRSGVAAQQAFAAQQAAAKAQAASAPKAPAGSSGGGGTSSGGGASSGGSAPGTGGGGSGGGGTAPPVGAVNDPAGAKAYAATKVGGGAEYTCLVQLWNKESGWRTNASNPSSGAYGIPQSLPGNKMASFGLDWQTNYRTQVDWGISYIQSSYGTMCSAWAHSVANNWY
ncbi:hypothetical protein [Frigoribacterium sp. RIT-PI-h]|uniref:aggregation-promoting factor C-terminal-like domain-containing protein n=1 Tax=Frigoribacterium sp. RIT-PI-h TaxID=1690245 RepID=UPI0006CE0E12|nr:hypothetical protein [Frigoribacterium sp. RIT-PI-h]KPG79269.1 hypothetical protein AEQ27_14040 [Frigoribacterium sp. RIT-PI-h]